MDAAQEQLFFSFKRLIHILTTGRKSPKEYGGVSLYKAEVHVVEMVGKRPGITASEIAEKMGVTKGAISQIVAKLFKKKLLAKQIHAENLRVHELNLTPNGEAVFAEHALHERKVVEAIVAELAKRSAEDVIALASIVDMISGFVEE